MRVSGWDYVNLLNITLKDRTTRSESVQFADRLYRIYVGIHFRIFRIKNLWYMKYVGGTTMYNKYHYDRHMIVHQKWP
jgi:hypothetical protein